MSIPRPLQNLLDGFYYLRRAIVHWIAFISVRFYAIEITFEDVKEGRYKERKHEDRNLDHAQDLDSILTAAKDCHKAALDRRGIVTDKCKTLLALSSFILAISSLFVPKSFEFDGWWMRILFFIAGLLILNAVVLLLVYFGVAQEATVVLTQSDASLSKDDLKKSLINSYLRCEVDSENRTDYLVAIYEASRFYAMSGFLIMLLLASLNYLGRSPSGDAERLIWQIRADPKLVELLRGPKGDKGEKGDTRHQGPVGNKGEPATRSFPASDASAGRETR